MRTKILSYAGTLSGLDVENSFLKRSECEIQTCESGAKAIQIAEAFNPALLIFEESMRDMGGVEATREILRNPRLANGKILLVFETEQAMAQCDLAESDRLAMVVRPIDAITFFGKVSKLLNIPTRIHVRSKVVFELKGRTSDNELFYAKMMDISTGGFLFQLDRPLKLGDIIYCFFSLSRNEQLVFASGRIVRFAGTPNSSSYLYGVEFVNLRADDRRRIAEFIFERSHPELIHNRMEQMGAYNVTFL